MKKLFLLGLFLVAPCYANGLPTWSTGSSNRTENTTQTITRSIVTAGTPLVTDPKPPTLAASPLVVVILVPLML